MYLPLAQDKLYIEFVGQHTAGKTAVIRDIVDRGLLEPRAAIYPQKIKRSRADFALRLPFLLLIHIKDVFFIIKFFVLYVKFTWTNYHSAGRHMWKMVLLHPYYLKYKFDIWMKDDLLHLLPRLEFRDNEKMHEAFLIFFNNFRYRYDGLVFVDLPYEVMKSRFEKRFKNRSVRRKQNREKVYERAFVQNIVLKKVLVDQDSVPILFIDGISTIEYKSSQVVKFIKSILNEK